MQRPQDLRDAGFLHQHWLHWVSCPLKSFTDARTEPDRAHVYRMVIMCGHTKPVAFTNCLGRETPNHAFVGRHPEKEGR